MRVCCEAATARTHLSTLWLRAVWSTAPLASDTRRASVSRSGARHSRVQLGAAASAAVQAVRLVLVVLACNTAPPCQRDSSLRSQAADVDCRTRVSAHRCLLAPCPSAAGCDTARRQQHSQAHCSSLAGSHAFHQVDNKKGCEGINFKTVERWKLLLSVSAAQPQTALANI